MDHESVSCLLNRLRQVNVFDTRGYNFFGFTNEKPPPPPPAKLDMSKFINRVTVEEMEDIATTKAQIVSVLNELKSLEAEAFTRRSHTGCMTCFRNTRVP